MKLLIALLALLPITADAKTLTLAWDYSNLTDVTGFRVYVSPIKGGYQFGSGFSAVATPNLQFQLTDVSDTVKTWAIVTAVGVNGLESAQSNELFLLPPSAPSGLKVKSVP